MNAILFLRKTTRSRLATYKLGILLALWLPSFSPAFGQNSATPSSTAPSLEEERVPKDAPEATTKKKKVDPRVLRREESERRERIEQLSFSQPELPRESDSLASTGIPKGLLPKRGIRSGRVIYLPSVTVGAVFSDNPLNVRDNREDDVIARTDTSIRAQSLLRRHEFGLEANAKTGHSIKGVEEDFLDWNVKADGRFDLDRQNAIRGGLKAILAEEADSSAEVDDGEEAELNSLTGNLGYLFNGRNLDVSIDGIVDREEFSGDNTGDRDNTTYSGKLRLSKNWNKSLTTFVSPIYAITEFDEEVADDGNDRDSYEITGLIGAEYRPRPRLRIGSSIGYSHAVFEDPNIGDQGTIVGSLSSRFAYSSATDFQIAADRGIDVTTVDGSANKITTSVSVGATHLLNSKHALGTEVAYFNTDFDESGRNDDDLSAGVTYFFRFSDHLILNLGYSYLERLSNDADEEFYENQASIGITLVY